MSKTNTTTDVEAALDLLATQVRAEIMRIRDEGADAMKQGDYDTAKSVIEFAGKLESFAGDVDKLVGQWNSIATQHDVEPETVKAIVGKTFFQRARKGTITPNHGMGGPRIGIPKFAQTRPQDGLDRVNLVEFKILEDLQLHLRGTKHAQLQPCQCDLEGFPDDVAILSINQAYTRLSERHESKRKSHSGNVFTLVYFHDGKLLLLWKGKEDNFDALSCEEIYGFKGEGKREHIVLDGQQRLTAMNYAFTAPEIPLPSRSNPYYYFTRRHRPQRRRGGLVVVWTSLESRELIHRQAII
ncbi:MAG: hypothetical protein K9N23_01055 [Akkermansiaceae bacterium]|nr:hypothetical protein [Akkermansiaceae bacterium]